MINRERAIGGKLGKELGYESPRKVYIIKGREAELKKKEREKEAGRGRKKKEAGEKVLGFKSSAPDSIMPDDLGHVTLPSVPRLACQHTYNSS